MFRAALHFFKYREDIALRVDSFFARHADVSVYQASVAYGLSATIVACCPRMGVSRRAENIANDGISGQQPFVVLDILLARLPGGSIAAHQISNRRENRHIINSEIYRKRNMAALEIMYGGESMAERSIQQWQWRNQHQRARAQQWYRRKASK